MIFNHRFFNNCGWLYSVTGIGLAAAGDTTAVAIYTLTAAACFTVDAYNAARES